MSVTKDIITHPGTIVEISEQSVFVNILAKSACSSCHAKGMCSVAEMEEKIIEVRKDPEQGYREGDEVVIEMRKALGKHAVFLGYLLPFLVLVISLILFITVFENEGLAALLSLGLLVPYYFILYKLKDRLKTKFEFRLQ